MPKNVAVMRLGILLGVISALVLQFMSVPATALVALACSVTVAATVIAVTFVRRREKTRLLRSLRDSWGTRVMRHRPFGVYESLLALLPADSRCIDAQTWYDLGMDDVFSHLDRTSTSPGELALYRMLRRPEATCGNLDERDAIIGFFQSNVEERERLRVALSRLGRAQYSDGFIDLIWGELPVRSRFAALYSCLAACALVSLLITIALRIAGSPSHIGGALCLGIFVVNALVHYWSRRTFDARVWSIKYVARMIATGRAVSASTRPTHQLHAVLQRLDKRSQSLYRLLRPAGLLLAEADHSYSLPGVFWEYVSIFFLNEVRAFNFILRFMRANRSGLQEIADDLGLLDAMLAVASFRSTAAFWSTPRFDLSKRGIEIRDLVHPLVSAPVANSISLSKKGCLVTGPNMAGKSTFLRGIGIAAVMAQSVATCAAAGYVANFVDVRASLSAQDDVLSGRSYYFAEAARLKEMIDNAHGVTTSLYLIDEMLRGTNSLERICISEEILTYLAASNAFVVAATHDEEMAGHMACLYDICHFEALIRPGEIQFDYLLRPGMATTRTAIALLNLLEFPSAIVEGAMKRCTK